MTFVPVEEGKPKHTDAPPDLPLYTVTYNLDAFAGQTIRLRFAEVDNQLFFQAGIDNVRVAPQVDLDIKPGSSTNPVNLTSKGVLSVAILSEAAFDATTVDVSSVTLGDDSGTETGVATKNNGTYHASQEDVDNDGDTDLVLKFNTQDLVDNGDLVSTTTELIINLADNNGVTYCGNDVVTITP